MEDRRRRQDYSDLAASIQAKEDAEFAKGNELRRELAKAAPMIGFLIGVYIMILIDLLA